MRHNAPDEIKILKTLSNNAPVAMALVIAGALAWAHVTDFYIWLIALVCILIMFITWVCIKKIDYEDIQVLSDFHYRIDSFDKDLQFKIQVGLQDIRLVNEDVEDPAEWEKRKYINSITLITLLPYVFQNHICKMLGGPQNKAYVQDKCKALMAAFDRDIFSTKYKKHVMCKLPSGISFQDLVESYINKLVIDLVIPGAIDCCYQKIYYYNSIIKQYKLSPRYKAQIIGYRDANRFFITNMEDLAQNSGVIRKSHMNTLLVEEGIVEQHTIPDFTTPDIEQSLSVF